MRRNTERSNDEVLVSIQNVSKKFCSNLRRSMAYGVLELSKNLIGMRNDSSHLRRDEFWALKDVNLELRRGDILGLIGVNGSGKSTLLRMLTGIFPPDKGEIRVKGRVGALIAVGAGFHPHMTGRENIYINATILGMTRGEIDRKFHDIVNFAEIGDFLDAPVSTYSSGMRVRLGFAIAVQIKPDVLFIDEVLAVGDIGFQAKCYNAIAEMSRDTAVIFVSHAMAQVSKICNRIAVLNGGTVTYLGSKVTEGINHYYSYFKPIKGLITGSGRASVTDVTLESKGKKGVTRINSSDNLNIYFKVKVDASIEYFVLDISFLNQGHLHIAQCNSLFNKRTFRNTGDVMDTVVRIPGIHFNPGIYMICVSVHDIAFMEIYVNYIGVKQLKVVGEVIGGTPLQIPGEWEVEC